VTPRSDLPPSGSSGTVEGRNRPDAPAGLFRCADGPVGGWRWAFAGRLAALGGWRRRGLSLLLGLLAVAALPPVQALPALWLSFPGLIWLIDGARTRRQAFLDGWWFGFGFFSAGLYWIAYALLVDPVRYGWMVPFAIFGLGGFLALFVGATTWGARRWARPGPARVMLFAALWVILEWVRSWLFTGFPWNLIGSVWLSVLPVAQVAALAGTFGLSLLTLLAAGLPALLARGGAGHRLAAASGLGLLVLAATWGALRMGNDPVPTVPGVRLRLVQANIEQTLKWKPEMRLQNLNLHLTLTQAPGWEGITDVIWPETAAPSFLDRDPGAVRLMAAAVPPGGLLIAGTVRGTAPQVEPFQVWNSLQAMDGSGAIVGTYDKAHLVPFGEYVPLHDWLPLAKITAGAVDFTPGPGPRTIALPGLPPVGPQICYEAIFPGAVVDRAHRPAWMLNVTNDGWYGISAGPYQHLAAARLRAIEEGLPLVRAANTGISAVVDPFGRITTSLGLGRRGVLDADLPQALPDQLTYARFGNAVPLILSAMLALGAVLCAAATREG